MFNRDFNKKIFFICCLLSQGIAKATWKSLYEEFEDNDNYNSYLYPIDVNASYQLNFSTKFNVIDNYVQKNNKEEVLFKALETDRKNYKGFINHGFRIDAGVLMTGYGFAKKFFCFPHFGLIYQHLFFPMKLQDNGSVDDFIFYFSPVTSPTSVFELVPRIGFGLSYIFMPREYYSKLTKIEDGTDDNGKTLWKIQNDNPVENFLYNGIDLALLYELVFRLRFFPEWTIFGTLGGIWRPLLFNKGVFRGSSQSEVKTGSIEDKVLQSLSVIDGGVGTFGASLGLNYNFKPAIEKPEWYNKLLRYDYNKVRFKAEFDFGVRDKYEIVQVEEEGTNRKVKCLEKAGKNVIAGGNLKTLLQFSNFQALGVGIGFYADFARKEEIADLEDKKIEYANWNISLLHQFIYNRLILENVLGINIKHGDKIGPGPDAEKTIMGFLFWTPSINFKLTDLLFFGIGAHVGILSAPIEDENLDQADMKTVKNKAEILKFEYLNLSFGIDWVVEPIHEYID